MRRLIAVLILVFGFTAMTNAQISGYVVRNIKIPMNYNQR